MHVTNELLYAELTGRIPIVYWKERSLYYENTKSNYDDALNNAFEYYFKPVSNYTVNDIVKQNYSYFPTEWSNDNIMSDSVASSTKPLPNTIDFPESDSDVLVSSSFRRMEDLQKIIPKENQLSRLTKEEIWHHYYRKYIFLKEEIKAKINDFYAQRLRGNNILGLHIRKTDKRSEQAIPHDSRFIKAVNSYLSAHAEGKIFLATDCRKTLEKFEKRYGDKLIYTDAIRGTGSMGIHFENDNKRLKGEQILQDVYILSKCNYFIGSLSTNIAYLVLYMLRDPSESKNSSTLVSLGSAENIETRIRSWFSNIKRLFRKTVKKI
jgi:hypothetical protein